MSQPDPDRTDPGRDGPDRDPERLAAQAVVRHHAQLATGLDQRVETTLHLVEHLYVREAEQARTDLLSYLRHEILPHARAEETALYPAAAARADGRLLVDGMVGEHRALTALVDELTDAASPVRAAAAARALAALFHTHLAKENDLVVPLLVAADEVSLADLLAGMHELLGADEPGTDGKATSGGGCGCGECGCGAESGAGPGSAVQDTPPVLSLDTRLDVRDVPHDRRHALVLSTVAALPPGAAVVLVASHAPRPVLAEIDDRFGAQVRAQWLQSGPTVWQVRLERVATPA